MELDRVGAYLHGSVVLVTGAGGSIGSELCRQITRVGARRLILVDHAEDNIFAIQRELLEDHHVHPDLSSRCSPTSEESACARCSVSIGRSSSSTRRPTSTSACSSATRSRHPQQRLGTRVAATVAGDFGAQAFVLISTDKAVSPSTVMGARRCSPNAPSRWRGAVCRHALHGRALRQRARLVRQRGSVFRRQIAAGDR